MFVNQNEKKHVVKKILANRKQCFIKKTITNVLRKKNTFLLEDEEKIEDDLFAETTAFKSILLKLSKKIIAPEKHQINSYCVGGRHYSNIINKKADFTKTGKQNTSWSL